MAREVLAGLSALLPPGPEELPQHHALTADEGARAAAAFERGYWSAAELDLRKAVLNERRRLGCISSFEALVLSSYDIDPSEAMAMMRTEKEDRLAVKEHEPNKVGNLFPPSLPPSIHPTALPPSPPSLPPIPVHSPSIIPSLPPRRTQMPQA